MEEGEREGGGEGERKEKLKYDKMCQLKTQNNFTTTEGNISHSPIIQTQSDTI